MTLSLMIMKKHLKAKVAEQEQSGTFIERRAYKPFWRKRIGSPQAWRDNGKAVFLCGSYAFDADVVGVSIAKTPPGIEEVPEDRCYEIECKFGLAARKKLTAFLFKEKED
jgi:hypothetical protein